MVTPREAASPQAPGSAKGVQAGSLASRPGPPPSDIYPPYLESAGLEPPGRALEIPMSRRGLLAGLAILAAWAALSFLFAVKRFRWV